MSNVASSLRRDEREAVAAYLGVAGGNPAPLAKAFCSDRSVAITGRSKSEWNGWSPATTNTRYQPGDAAGLTIDQVRRLAEVGVCFRGQRFQRFSTWFISSVLAPT